MALSAAAEETPLSSYAETSWTGATTMVSFEEWPNLGLPFPFLCVSPFPPILWFLSHAPFKKWIDWMVTLLIFRPLL